jgi:hypothetical protein
VQVFFGGGRGIFIDINNSKYQFKEIFCVTVYISLHSKGLIITFECNVHLLLPLEKILSFLSGHNFVHKEQAMKYTLLQRIFPYNRKIQMPESKAINVTTVVNLRQGLSVQMRVPTLLK